MLRFRSAKKTAFINAAHTLFGRPLCFAVHRTFSIAENAQENGPFARSFGLTGPPFGRCFRVAAATPLTGKA
jgi:hypothetical protein